MSVTFVGPNNARHPEYDYDWGEAAVGIWPPLPPSTVPRDAFLNAIRILHSLDEHELPGINWPVFADNPDEFLMRADDPTADIIWKAIQKRQPARYRA